MNMQGSRLGTEINKNKSSKREVLTKTKCPEIYWQCDVMYKATV